MLTLKGKNVVITGASSGIGRECAINASRLGANIILIARNVERLKGTLENLDKGNHIYLSCDITNYKSIEEVVEQAVEKVGRISGFIHSAGIEKTVPLRSMNHEKYAELFAVNVISGFEVARLISKKKYLDKVGASFVFISSVMGLLGQYGKIGYCSSKGALCAGVKAMALELASKKIRVNAVLPGVVMTEMSEIMFDSLPEDSQKGIISMHPLGLGTSEDVANLCSFFLSDLSRWITGTNTLIDGGYSAQ